MVHVRTSLSAWTYSTHCKPYERQAATCIRFKAIHPVESVTFAPFGLVRTRVRSPGPAGEPSIGR
ncbi:hypothetical protein GCM10009539_54100 [Cryptosporangium japonicum]|uniref:Uncharacterized protein n=1 Tax=Cryptosporangium japonicum TaxID=80872 RepID=A0ABP3EHE3_9ACTN